MTHSQEIRNWKDIHNGIIFYGWGKVAPLDFPEMEASGGYGHGFWLKINDNLLYSFEGNCYWLDITEKTWFEEFHIVDKKRLMENLRNGICPRNSFAN